jgi:GntR family transcriptional regulator / MocR family aminotransferase
VDLEIEFRDGVSLRRQLEDALRVAIRSGRLPPGSVLPPSRDLAEQLRVSRGVVVDSYAQLLGQIPAGRQRRARRQPAGPDRHPQRVLELAAEGEAVPELDLQIHAPDATPVPAARHDWTQ